MTKTLAVAVALLLAALGWQWGRAEHALKQAAVYQTERNAAWDALAAEQAARAKERLTREQLQEALDAEHKARLALEDDARRADAAARSLRERARALAGQRCPARDAEAAAGSPATDPAGDLLAELLERIDEAAGEVGRYADQARLAGLTCERAYDALTPPTAPPR